MLLVFSKYLSEQNYKDKISDFEDNYSSHPNYPSLFAITDSLGFMGIENIAAKVEKEQLTNLPSEFIAEIKLDGKKTFVFVKKNIEEYNLLDESGNKHVLSLTDFNEIWTSTIVAIEANKNKINHINRSNKLVWLIILLIPISSYSFLFSNFPWNEVIFNFLLFLGLIISFLIINEKFFHSFDSIASKFCSSKVQNKGCETVLNADVLPGKKVEFSDLPIIFFLTGFISILINNNSWFVIGFLCLLSIPVILVSFYLQAFKLKSFCKLCMTISFIILANAFIFLSNNDLGDLQFDFYEILYVLMTGLFISFSWFATKGLFKELKEVKSEKINLLKFKKKFALFSHLSKKVKNVEELKMLEGILIGNTNADLKLRLFISPSCSYCHKAYIDALNLMNNYPQKIKIEIFYNVNIENKDNPYLDIVRNTMALHLDKPENLRESLDDWHIKNMSLNKWISKWGGQDLNYKNLDFLLKQHYNWCKVNEFNYTPVKILESAIIPEEYEIQEIGFFLTDIISETPNIFLEETRNTVPV